ncbi:MAG: translation initiation factor IF-2 subunit gamma [Candidatus Aenigmatarchaeota archaeon]
MSEKILPDMNIGIVGHVDHGKTTLTETLTGKWASVHSEELRRGITIRLGYADAIFYKCHKCGSFQTTPKCRRCFEDCEPVRAVSIVDAPGHETLMATVLSGASLMDAAILVIAANEDVPQPQTAEHLKALDIVGIKDIIIAQNKIDLVSEESAVKNYNAIKNFVKGTVAENAPIIPVSALHNANIDILIQAVMDDFKPTVRRSEDDPLFLIARSFDVNKPGTPIEKLVGGVIGGSMISGTLSTNDEIAISPIQFTDGSWRELKTKITSINQGKNKLDKAKPGGLIALGTMLDPSLTRGDGFVGRLAGMPGKLPQISGSIKMKITLFDYVVGIKGQAKVERIKSKDSLMLTAIIARTVGSVISAKKDEAEVVLKIPICVRPGDKVAISKQIEGRWHLIGWGIVK